jgi:hypothetical protein
MKTSTLIRRALKYLGAVSGADPVPAEDFADALAEYNIMLSELKTVRGLTIPFAVPAQTGAEDCPFPEGFQGGLAAMLAVRLAPEYGGQIAAETVSQADQCWARLAMEYHVIPSSSDNLTLTNYTLRGTRSVFGDISG